MNATITIGRSHECDIMVTDPNISRIHARISRVGGQYVFEDVSSNGSTLNGQTIRGQRIKVAPGAPILLANRVPLPWNQVYQMLPAGPVNPYEEKTNVYSGGYQQGGAAGNYVPVYADQDRCSAGFWILCFFFPIVGWILWGVWRRRLPNRAHSVAVAAWIGFAVGMGLNIMLAALM